MADKADEADEADAANAARAGPGTGLLLVLTGAAASADALSYLGLGQVFPANMTGNTVLLAVDVTARDYSGAVRSAVALGGFLVGAGVTALAGRDRMDAGRLRGLLAGELALLVAVAAGWLAAGTQPGGAGRLVLIGLLSLGMGVQSGTVTALDVGVSTTFITGTWTAVSVWLAARLAGRPDAPDPAAEPVDTGQRARVGVVLCYLGVALASGYAYWAGGAAAVPMPALAVAVAGLWVGVRARVPGPHG